MEAQGRKKNRRKYPLTRTGSQQSSRFSLIPSPGLGWPTGEHGCVYGGSRYRGRRTLIETLTVTIMVGKFAQSPDQRSSRVVIHNSLASNLQRNHSPFEAVVATSSGNRDQPSHTTTTTTIKTTTSTVDADKPRTTPLQVPSSASRERSRSSSKLSPREMVYVDSKERLSEMVTNIRGISNSLSNVTLAVSVQNVLVVAKLSDEELPENARSMVEWLLKWEHDPQTIRSANSQLELAVKHRREAEAQSHNAIIEQEEDDNDVCTPHTRCSQKPLRVFVEREFAQKPEFGLEEMQKNLDDSERDRLKFWSPESPPDAEKIDLIITLGGDGTVLYTSWLFQKMVPPTISFGMGSLGFMTENQFEEYPQILEEHLDLGICCALRMRFECTIMRTHNQEQYGSADLERELHFAGRNHRITSHTRDGEYTILNEVVVDRGPNPFVTMTELYGNFELLTSITADGVVISTPTGSTAYSMSAGGSLVHPDISARLISPICPHTLSFRPLVVPDSMVLHIGVPYDARSSAFVSFDGKARVELRRGDFLTINASPYPFPKVLPQENSSVSWVQQLSRTLHWNEQKRPKRYTDGSQDHL